MGFKGDSCKINTDELLTFTLSIDFNKLESLEQEKSFAFTKCFSFQMRLVEFFKKLY